MAAVLARRPLTMTAPAQAPAVAAARALTPLRTTDAHQALRRLQAAAVLVRAPGLALEAAAVVAVPRR